MVDQLLLINHQIRFPLNYSWTMTNSQANSYTIMKINMIIELLLYNYWSTITHQLLTMVLFTINHVLIIIDYYTMKINYDYWFLINYENHTMIVNYDWLLYYDSTMKFNNLIAGLHDCWSLLIILWLWLIIILWYSWFLINHGWDQQKYHSW